MGNKLVWPIIAIVCALAIGGGLYFGLRGSGNDGEGGASLSNGGRGAAGGVTVYTTRTGERYHRGGCQYLSRSKIPMSLSTAKARYRPCSRCGPPR